MSAAFTPDLDAYFARIGYAGPRNPSLATLTAIHQHHACAIPFENLDVLLGRGISLDPAAIEQKLVHAGRGGYCFEQNGLFLAVLRTLGFQVTPHLARVRWQVAPDAATPLTHMVLRVVVDGRPWLADAGFGGVGLVSPIALDTDAEQGDPREPRRLLRRDRHLVHQFWTGQQWSDVYVFTLDEVPPIDFEVGNWFTSAHPKSRFRQSLIVALAATDRRFAIQDREFTIRHAGGPAEKHAITSPDELLSLLAGYFGLNFPAGTRFGPPGSPWPS